MATSSAGADGSYGVIEEERVNRRTAIGSLVALAIACAALYAFCQPGRPPASSSDRPVIRWGGPKNISMLPIVAQANGFFEEAGVDVRPNYLQTGKAAMDAVVSGDLDVGIIVETNIALIKYQAGADVKVITGVMRKRDDALVARADQGIRRPADLVGKSIAIVPATTSHRFADRFIEFYKLDRSKITFVNSTPPGIQAGLLSGKIVGGAIWEPFRHNLQTNLGKKLVQFDDPKIYTSYVLAAVRGADVPRLRDGLVRYLRALRRAQEFIRSNREKSIQLLAAEIGMAPDVLSAVWDRYEHEVAIDGDLQQVFEDAGHWAKRAQDSLRDAPMPSYSDVIDRSVLEAIGDAKWAPKR
jgi:sulfonate transport system substrate-binding protein